MKNIRKNVYSYKTKYEEGFVQSEVDDLLKNYPNIHMDRFHDALNGNTCMVKDGEIIMYHCDIEKALRCGVENRSLQASEFD